MTGTDKRIIETVRNALQEATIKCSERCLYQAAKWAAEASVSPDQSGDDSGSETEIDSPMDGVEANAAPSVVLVGSTDPFEARLEAKETQKYLLAKSYFDCREFERCASVFLPSPTSRPPMRGAVSARSRDSAGQARGKGAKEPVPPADKLPRLSQKSLFLALYARYMSGEKKREEATEMILGPQDKASVENPELVGVLRYLEQYFTQRSPDRTGDGFLEYLHGVVLAKSKNEHEAKRWLLESVNLYPCNWSAWLELNDLVGSLEDLNELKPHFPAHVMTMFFSLYANQMLCQVDEVVYKLLADLEGLFPSSLFVQTQRALLSYHAKDHVESEAVFNSILQQDPYRLDAMDHYSNLLYVMRARPKLAFLAQIASTTDKFRPETCCVVGNYYSLKSEHEKAVSYFRRALMLDRGFGAAWTLMGHEFVEMKNTHAAIESYRRAVDANRKDYRAWYGLGQTYEILEMHLYALFYYQRAASLRPYDATMWNAVGACYDKVGRPVQSIQAYQRSLVASTYYDTAATKSFGSASSSGGPPASAAAPDPWAVADTFFNIAVMYEKLGNVNEAANYMELTLSQEDGAGADDEDEDDDRRRSSGTGPTMTTSKARMWLARWTFARGDLKRAMELANDLCHDGYEVEESKALIRDIRARIEAAGGDPGV